jgi:putative ABC transport system ATP-binding protein
VYPTAETPLSAIRSRKVGFIFQDFHLIASKTAIHNVMLPLQYQGIERHERVTRAADALRAVGLGHRFSHRPSELSGGEKQRVAIARAICSRPSVLLADEPSGNLDSKSEALILELIVDLSRSAHLPIVVATHSERAARVADRVVQMVDGRFE